MRHRIAPLLLLLVPALASAERPNLIVIQTDEHSFRTLGCYRDQLSPEQAHMWGKGNIVETPHIDSLAKNGVICTSFYATTPVCSPSRAALVSGRYPHNTPVNTNNIPLDDGIITFAEILRREGYATGFIGKWHLDGSGKPQWEPERKFGFEDNRYMFNRGHWKQFEDTPQGPRVKPRDKSGKPSYGVDGADAKSFATDFLMRKAGEFVVLNKAKPFCLMVSLPDPHGPDTVRVPYDTMYEHMKFEKPRTWRDDPKAFEGFPAWAIPNGKFQNMAKYYGMVKCIDDRMGELLAQLRELEIFDNTVVVLTSDHGDLRGEHNRQNKGVPYEASAKIPFLLQYPAKIKNPKVVNEALTCIDFLPTVLKIMEVKTAGEEEGRDASALFLSDKTPAGWEDVAFMRGTGEKTWLAAVTDRYKLVVSPFADPWLFDLEEDADEMKNFFGSAPHRETIRDLSRELLAYGQKFGDPVMTSNAVQTDLKWGAEGEGAYSPPERKARPKPNPLRRKLEEGKKRQKRKKKNTASS